MCIYLPYYLFSLYFCLSATLMLIQSRFPSPLSLEEYYLIFSLFHSTITTTTTTIRPAQLQLWPCYCVVYPCDDGGMIVAINCVHRITNTHTQTCISFVEYKIYCLYISFIPFIHI